MLSYTKDTETGELEESLLGCMSDICVCAQATCCLPVAEARAWASARGETCTICHMCVPTSPIWTRANIHRARGMEPGLCMSAVLCTCCPCCFTAQNIREIKAIAGMANDEASP